LDAPERVPIELRVLWFGSLRRKDQEDGTGGDAPPMTGGEVLGRGGEMILVETESEVGVGVGSGMGREEVPDDG